MHVCRGALFYPAGDLDAGLPVPGPALVFRHSGLDSRWDTGSAVTMGKPILAD